MKTNEKNCFWYSEIEQRDKYKRMSEGRSDIPGIAEIIDLFEKVSGRPFNSLPINNFCKLLNGEVVLYTEWRSDGIEIPAIRTLDKVFLGYGEYHHSEPFTNA